MKKNSKIVIKWYLLNIIWIRKEKRTRIINERKIEENKNNE